MWWNGLMPGHRKFTFLVGAALFLALDFGAKSLDRWWRPRPPPQTHLSIRVAHPEYDHGICPNAAGRESYGSQSADYFSNSLGLRDEVIREIPLQSNLPRFLFMGDSMTEAGPVPWKQTFVGQLQDRWKGKAEVLNGAVVDFGPSLILPKCRSLMVTQGLQVENVVVVLNPSVIRTAFTYGEGADGKIQHRRYGPYQDRADFFDRTGKVEAWLENGVEKRFVLLGALVRNLRLTWRKCHPDTRAMDRLKSWVEDPSRANAEEQKLVREAIRRTEASLDGILEFLQSRNSSLVVVFLPWPKMILHPDRHSWLVADFRQWAEGKGVPFLDFSGPLCREGAPAEVLSTYFLKNDNHLTAAGHAWVAEQLAERLRPGFPEPPGAVPQAGSKR
jgi:hypothetical protein